MYPFKNEAPLWPVPELPAPPHESLPQDKNFPVEGIRGWIRWGSRPASVLQKQSESLNKRDS